MRKKRFREKYQGGEIERKNIYIYINVPKKKTKKNVKPILENCLDLEEASEIK